MCLRVCPWTYAYTGPAIHAVNLKYSGRIVVQPRTVVDQFPRNQLLQCFEFHDKHGRNRRKERICFDHELVRDQTNFAAIDCVRACHEIQSIGAIDFRVKSIWA